MEIIFRKSFIKNLKILPKHIQESTREVIKKIETAKNLETSGLDCKKMEGQKKDENYYRIRVGDWRIGIQYLAPRTIIVTILHRGTIYKKFPPQ